MGALVLILGGAFLFMLANILGARAPHFDADDKPPEIANPHPRAKNNFTVRLPFARRIYGFLFLDAIRRPSPVFSWRS